MRIAEIARKTTETDIRLRLNIDGVGQADVNTGIGFLDHMLNTFARHGRFDINIECTGDTFIDDHHTAEDVGITLGKAFAEALSEKRGISRFGDRVIPMDEALILSAVDFSGRAYLEFQLDIPTEKVGTFDTELVKEFWMGFTGNAGCTLHIRQLAGSNSHHIIEGAFKSVARSIRDAVAVEERFNDEIPSTKGLL